MAIIRELDENGNIIEPCNIIELVNKYEYYMKNTKRVDRTINYKHLKIGMFESYQRICNSNCDIDSLFPVLFQEIQSCQ